MAAAPNIPSHVHVYVDATTGSDTVGTGAIGAPFETLDRALASVRSSGYDNSATISVVNSVNVTDAVLNLTVIGIGQQKTPLVLQGSGRTVHVATEQTITGVVLDKLAELPADCGSGLPTLTVDGPGLFTAAHAGKLLRFTNQPVGTELFISQVLSATSVQVAVSTQNGFAPSVGDTVVVESPHSQVIFQSQTTVIQTSRALLYNLHLTPATHQNQLTTLILGANQLLLSACVLVGSLGTNWNILSVDSHVIAGVEGFPLAFGWPVSKAGVALNNSTVGALSLQWRTPVGAPTQFNNSVVLGHGVGLNGHINLQSVAVVASPAAPELGGGSGVLTLTSGAEPANLQNVLLQRDDAKNQPILFLSESTATRVDQVSIIGGAVSDSSVGILHQAPGTLRITNTYVRMKGQRALQATDKGSIINFFNLRLLALADLGDIKEIACTLDAASFLGDSLVIRGAAQRGVHGSTSTIHINGGSISGCADGGITLDSQCRGKLLEITTDPDELNGQYGLKLFGQTEISVSVSVVNPLRGVVADVMIGNNSVDTTWASVGPGVSLEHCSDFLVAAPPGTQLCKLLRMA